jgi:hypothetical protein
MVEIEPTNPYTSKSFAPCLFDKANLPSLSSSNMDTNALSLDKESMRLGLFADESTIFKLPPVKVIGYLWIQLSVFRNENRRKCADIVLQRCM